MIFSQRGTEASPALHNDLYQLTMAFGYWRSGVSEREAEFHLSMRRHPFAGGFAVACGMADAVEWLMSFAFKEGDIEYLGELSGSDGRPMFPAEFLDYLRNFRLRCTVWSVPEGTPIFAREPIVTVRGPILHCQLLETGLLNILNFQTLIATKAARVRLAAGDTSVLEFGLRRAQGPDGGLSASRAAFIGGCDATSNVLAGRDFGIPVRGTHAHSWVQAFPDEETAFEKYAQSMPANCVFLVDTFDTPAGIDRAIRVGHKLAKRGYRMLGVRLDSGDLFELSKIARSRLDAAGMQDASVVASGDLDEWKIADLRRRGAPIDTWGVGTQLATGAPDAALAGVYKLSALRDTRGNWVDKLKLSEEPKKTSLPGLLQVHRYREDGQLVCDVIADRRTQDVGNSWVDPDHPSTVRKTIGMDSEPLLRPLFEPGRVPADTRSLTGIREDVLAWLAELPAGVTDLAEAQKYPVGFETSLWHRRLELEKLFREAN